MFEGLKKWNDEWKEKGRKKMEEQQKKMEGIKQKMSDNNKKFKEEMRKFNEENDPGLLVCPECGSEDLQVVTETHTEGKDFGARKACCGYVLFGPLGMLCGACGKGKQVKSDTFFLCKGCGHRFKKLTKTDMMCQSDEWKKRYAGFQAAARKRRGIEEPEVVDVQASTEGTPADKNEDAPSQNS